tara:strand:- start:1774 stop:2115 length:342 start_codon:yes stop_codon:yes gene_type:complete
MSVKIKILGKSVSVESAREIWLELGEVFDHKALPPFEYDDTLDLSNEDDAQRTYWESNVSWDSVKPDNKAAMGLVTFAQSEGFTLEDDFWHSDTGIVSQAVMNEMHKDYLFEL